MKLLVFVFLFLSCISAAASKLQVETLLKRLNKSPEKSIKSPDGDIIDCIHISQQPAFDHPVLKNHKIQMEPSHYPGGPKSSEELPVKQLWQLNGECDEGTIPVRRTKKEDVLRARSVEEFGKKKNNINILGANFTKPHPQTNHEYAIARVTGDEYIGTKANLNYWEPEVQQPNEFSLAQVWVAGGSSEETNTIEAGWQVYRGLYGDSHVRLFVYWTSDDYQSTGCYNMLCSGFVQISQKIVVGAAFFIPSSYEGSQFIMPLLIWKDPIGGVWWLKVGDEFIGYWPASLFTNLADGATRIDWGGEVVNLASGGQHTTTHMGSGHFPGEGFRKASYFRNIQVLIIESDQLEVPKTVSTVADKPGCYDIQVHKDWNWGFHFYYGGPGRNLNCP